MGYQPRNSRDSDDDALTRPDLPTPWPRREADSPYAPAPARRGAPPPPSQPPQRQGARPWGIIALSLVVVLVCITGLLALAPRKGGAGLGIGGPTATPIHAPPTATPLPGLTATLLFNNVGISDDSEPSIANLDVFGDSFSAQALAKVGLVPGQTFTYDGVRFVWPQAAPGTADNMQVQGQTVTVTTVGVPTTLAFLGASHFGNAQFTISIVYRDGTQQSATLGLSDWTLFLQSAPQYGNGIAATLPYYNSGTRGQVKSNAYLFYAEIPLRSRHPILRIVFPQPTGLSQMHIFAVGAK